MYCIKHIRHTFKAGSFCDLNMDRSLQRQCEMEWNVTGTLFMGRHVAMNFFSDFSMLEVTHTHKSSSLYWNGGTSITFLWTFQHSTSSMVMHGRHGQGCTDGFGQWRQVGTMGPSARNEDGPQCSVTVKSAREQRSYQFYCGDEVFPPKLTKLLDIWASGHMIT